jgi:hypothetical protein
MTKQDPTQISQNQNNVVAAGDDGEVESSSYG